MTVGQNAGADESNQSTGEMTMEKISRVGAIKRYFEADDTQAPGGGRKITMDELRALSAADREELAQMAAKKLGVELADA